MVKNAEEVCKLIQAILVQRSYAALRGKTIRPLVRKQKAEHISIQCWRDQDQALGTGTYRATHDD
jgi:hypothetical protein